jgi:hypothetical protein
MGIRCTPPAALPSPVSLYMSTGMYEEKVSMPPMMLSALTDV